MSKLAWALAASVLTLAGSALVAGCGGSSGGTTPDASPDSMNMGDAKQDVVKPHDGGVDTGKGDGGGDACPTFPAFVIDMVQKDTNSTSKPTPIPPCWGSPPKPTDPASATEFKSIVP